MSQGSLIAASNEGVNVMQLRERAGPARPACGRPSGRGNRPARATRGPEAQISYMSRRQSSALAGNAMREYSMAKSAMLPD